MPPGAATTFLSVLAALLGGIAAASGLLWPAGAPLTDAFISVHGEPVILFGRGLYRFDSLLLGAGFIGQDVIILSLGVPALLLAAWRARATGHVKWLMLRLVVMTFFTYVYASMALSAFYNPLFLLYVATVAASMFGLAFSALEFRSMLSARWSQYAKALPSRGPVLLLFISGVFTAFIWSQPLVTSLVNGTVPPLLGHSMTKVTEVLDLAIIVPCSLLAAILVRRQRLDGYVLAVPLLGLLVLLFPTITASTISQLRAGAVFTLPEIIGPIAGFLVFGVVGAALLLRIATQLSTVVEVP